MIKTFIFLDLETTGLIKYNSMPKITELSLITVSRNAICETMEPLPRVLHKLVLPIQPNIFISKEVEKITGLSNEKLEGIQCFSHETCDLIQNFINSQATPACFVAYNGKAFDFPILLSEVKSNNKNFSRDILSIDMLDLIKEFYAPKKDLTVKTNVTQTKPMMSNADDISSLLNDDCDRVLCDILDSVMSSNLVKHENNTLVEKDSNTESSTNNLLSTPKSSKCYEKIQKMNEETPKSQILKSQDSDKSLHDVKKNTARKQLNFTCRPTNFKLSTVNQHICGTKAENEHSAEGDCLTMIRCAIQLGDFFVEWADKNAIPLIEYEKR